MTGTGGHLFAAPPNTLTAVDVPGWAGPVAGVVWRGGAVPVGLPLGGIGTGYVDLGTDGRLGNTTIFGDFPTPASLAEPFLGVVCDGESRLLTLAPPEGAAGVADIAYLGHFPVADLGYDTDLPVGIFLRAFAPFVPGDAAVSNVPAAVFELTLTAPPGRAVDVDVACSFPGPAPRDGERFTRTPLRLAGGSGVAVTSPRHGRESGYALLALKADAVTTSSRPETPAQWADLAASRPLPGAADPGTSLTARVRLAAGESRTVTLLLAWYFPHFRVFVPYRHRYGFRFGSVVDVVAHLAATQEATLARIAAWQQQLYGADLPGWLADALVNSLYSLARNTWWTASDLPDDWWGPDGLLTHSESFVDCPITETMVCRFHGHLPALLLFPELEKSTLRAFAHYQLASGEVPFCFGMPAGLYSPQYSLQHPLNTAQFVQLVHRYLRRTGDRAFLAELPENLSRAADFLDRLDVDGDGLVEDRPHAFPGELFPANQFYDLWPWRGTSCYVGGIGLAAWASLAALAGELGDAALAARCRDRIGRGQASFETKLWAGDRYLLWRDGADTSDVSLANQLVAQWSASTVGLPGPLDPDHARAALDYVRRRNLAVAPLPVNAVDAAGTPYRSRQDADEDDHSANCFVGENTCVAATLVVAGQRAAGLDVARRLYDASCLSHRTPWHQHCIVAAADGHPIWGADYYSNLAVWWLLPALAGGDVAAAVRPGSVVDRLLAAANPTGAR